MASLSELMLHIYSWAIAITLQHRGHQKGVAEEGPGEQQKLIIIF